MRGQNKTIASADHVAKITQGQRLPKSLQLACGHRARRLYHGPVHHRPVIIVVIAASARAK
jgi:hypothetical protein